MFKFVRRRSAGPLHFAGIHTAGDRGWYCRVAYDDDVGSIDVEQVVAKRGESRPAILAALAAEVPQDFREVTALLGNTDLKLDEFTLRAGNKLVDTLELEAYRQNRFEGADQRILVPANGEIDSSRRVIGYLRAAAADSYADELQQAGFRAIAMDFEGCAARRSVPNVEALVVVPSDGPVTIWGFGTPIVQYATVERTRVGTVSNIYQKINSFEHSGHITVSAVGVLGSIPLCDELANVKALAEISVRPVVVAGVESPEWYLAYGAATFGIEQFVDGEVAYAV